MGILSDSNGQVSLDGLFVDLNLKMYIHSRGGVLWSRRGICRTGRERQLRPTMDNMMINQI